MSDRITIRDIGRLPLPGMDAPSGFAFSPDGTGLTYLDAANGSLVRSLWYRDLATGRAQILVAPDEAASAEATLSQDERLRRERSRTSALGVTDYRWSADAPTIAVLMSGSVLIASGARWPASIRRLDGGAAQAAIPSPDGALVAVVRDGDLWLHSVASGDARRVTHDAGPGVFNALPEYIAAEELGRSEGMWWGRDSSAIAFARVDERAIAPYVIPHPAAPAHHAETHRYPFAGGPNAEVKLMLLDVAEGAIIPVDLGAPDAEYVARVIPEADGTWLVATLPRQQQSLIWRRVARDGSVHALWEERSEPWLNLDQMTRALGDGRILRAVETGAGGHRHLLIRGHDGVAERMLTTGGWDVVELNAVDEERGTVLFTATHGTATERHLFSVALDAAAPIEEPRRHTAEPGWHEVVADRHGRRWVDTWSSRSASPSVRIVEVNGHEVVLHGSSMSAGADGPREPEILALRAADGVTRINAALYLPANPASDPPPCVVWTYGGPHVQVVRDAWELTISPLRRYLADAGAAVLVTDGRGSANRGLAFEAILHHNMGADEIDDQAAAVRQLAGQGRIDPERVAITGGSYGGFATIMAMLRHPDLFRAGVAVAPVIAWEDYDTAYTERYLGMPDGGQDGPYARSSPLARAAALRGSLLLIHGAIDENVHLRHSLRFIAALQAAGIDVELVILPDDRHRVRTPAGLLTRDRRTVRHLLRGIGIEPPDDGITEPGGQAAS